MPFSCPFLASRGGKGLQARATLGARSSSRQCWLASSVSVRSLGTAFRDPCDWTVLFSEAFEGSSSSSYLPCSRFTKTHKKSTSYSQSLADHEPVNPPVAALPWCRRKSQRGSPPIQTHPLHATRSLLPKLALFRASDSLHSPHILALFRNYHLSATHTSRTPYLQIGFVPQRSRTCFPAPRIGFVPSFHLPRPQIGSVPPHSPRPPRPQLALFLRIHPTPHA